MNNMLNRIRTLWYITKYQYFFRKATFGTNTMIKCKLSIVGPGKVKIGSDCIFEPDPWGDGYVTFYTHRRVATIVIGNSVIMRSTLFGSHLSIIIQDNSILDYASFFDSDYHNVDATQRNEDFDKKNRAVIIGKGCYVGTDCLCSKGAKLGDNVIMLPGSMMGAKTIPPNIVIGGNPSRLIKQ